MRHTSNELYADVVETLSVTLAPSGRPLAAFAHGTIAFTCKVSGVPDIVVSLAGPGGVRHSLSGLIDLPVFHPCVRLARWKERPGELSFIPPDGRFILAGYEVDLLPQPWAGGASAAGAGSGANPLKLPVSLEVRTGLGPTGADFEVKLQVHSRVLGGASSSSSSAAAAAAATGFGRGGGSLSGVGGNPQAGTPAAPTLQDVSVTVPLPADVRNLSEVRPSRGDAAYSPGDRHLEWHIPAKELAAGTAFFGLRCTVVGQTGGEGEGQEGADLDPTGFGFGSAGRDYSYDEREKPYQSSGGGGGGAAAMGGGAAAEGGGGGGGGCGEDDRDERRVAQNKILMPSSAAVSFAVRGWLPSGIRIESILIDPRKSRGLSENVKPYKGVRYLAVSKGGVEIRC